MTIGVIPARIRDSSESLLVAQLDVIDAVVAFIARQHRLSAADAQEFRAHVHLKLLDDDCAVLRKFQERSDLRTYLTTVIQRLFLDDRAARWGKWRASAEAKRLGPLGILVERLTVRDGLTLDEAREVIATNHRMRVSCATIAAIHARLPRRLRRRIVGEEAVAESPAPGCDADRCVADAARREIIVRALEALGRAIAAMPAQDRLIVRLRFKEGLTLAEIARTLSLDQKAFYRRMAGLLRALRAALEREGVEAREILALLGRPDVDVRGVFE